jgi:hypothetical protein
MTHNNRLRNRGLFHQRLDLQVLFSPELLYPSVKFDTKNLIIFVIAVHNLFRHIHCLDTHNHPFDLAAEKLPEGRNAIKGKRW